MTGWNGIDGCRMFTKILLAVDGSDSSSKVVGSVTQKVLHFADVPVLVIA